MSHPGSAVPVRKHPALLANANFMILWLGQTVSQLGSAFFNFAMAIWIIRTAGTPALAGIMMVAAIPGIVLGPVAGTLVDSMDRKKIIVSSDLFLGCVMLMAAWLMYQQAFHLAHIYLLLIVVNIVQPLFGSAISAVLPGIVHGERLSQANSMRQASSSGTGLLGPSLAAVLLAILGGVEKAIPLFFTINGISFILSGISEMFLKIKPLEKLSAGSTREAFKAFKAKLAEGFKYVWQSKMIARLIIIMALINFFLGPVGSVVIPGVIIDVLALDEMWLGFIHSALAGGFLLAAILLSIIKQNRLSRLVVTGVLSIGGAICMMGLTMALPLYIAAPQAATIAGMIIFGMLAGASAAAAQIALSTIMQKAVPAEKRGRVFAFMNTFVSGLVPLSLGAAGLAALLAPLFIQPVIGGAAIMGAGLMLKKVKELRRY